MPKPHVQRWHHLNPRTATGPIKLATYVQEAAGDLVVLKGEDGEYPDGLNPEWIAWVERHRDNG